MSEQEPAPLRYAQEVIDTLAEQILIAATQAFDGEGKRVYPVLDHRKACILAMDAIQKIHAGPPREIYSRGPGFDPNSDDPRLARR